METLETHVFDKQYRVLSLVYEPGDTVLWLSGDCNPERNQTVFLKSVSKDNPVIEPTKSTALTGLRLEQAPVLTVYPFPCSFWGDPAFGIAFGWLFATVTNTGAVPVSRFWVNGRFNSCWNTCYYQTQFAKHFEIPLAPGESVEVLLTDAFQVSGALNDLSDTTYNFCFWTALPDDALDALPDDDRYCQVFSLVVANEEPAASANTVRVAPNPATDQTTFFLEAPDAAGISYRLVLTTAAGQVVRQEAFAGPTWTLERGALPAGLYFYQITSRRGGVGVGRVVLGH